MTALRRTKPNQFGPIRAASRIGFWFVAAFGLFGCGSAAPPPVDPSPGSAGTPMPGSNDPSWLTSRESLPAPDTDRIEYDTGKRTLILYDLPSRDYWMVQLPEETAGHLVGPQHCLPEGVDTARTFVFYVRAGVKMSAPVTVAQIEAGRLAHTSMSLGQE